jgi:hypothetical protein
MAAGGSCEGFWPGGDAVAGGELVEAALLEGGAVREWLGDRH